MLTSDSKTLIVVFKNELYANQIRKLLETNDDIDENTVVGVKDGSVRVVTWDEKTWLDQKKTGKIGSKVLLIGNIKQSDKLLPLVDFKYNEFGIKYGWSGNQAIITADTRALSQKDKYDEFLKINNAMLGINSEEDFAEKEKKEETEELSEKDNQESTYTQSVVERIEKEKTEKETQKAEAEENKPQSNSVFDFVPFKILMGIIQPFETLVTTGFINYFGNIRKMEEQQYLYGLRRFYLNDLDKFLNG